MKIFLHVRINIYDYSFAIESDEISHLENFNHASHLNQYV